MKKFARLIIPLFFATLAMTVCDDDGGDSGARGKPAGKFTTEVNLGDSSDYNGGIFGNVGFRHYQLLYRSSDIKGSGYIRSLYFKYANTESSTRCPHLTIKIAHTSLDALDTTDMALNINNGKGNAVTVLDDVTITIPAGDAGTYFEIPLRTQFNYNGVDNIVVDITRTENCSQMVEIIRVAGTYTSNIFSNDSADPDTPDGNTQNVLHTKFGFTGGENTVLETTGGGRRQPFNDDGNPGRKVQLMYEADEINGSGLITGIAFQLGTETADDAGYWITVKMGHRRPASGALVNGFFADSYDAGGPVTVADNVFFSVPAGIPAGSYIWLPLPDAKFSYNGTDNLVVEIETLIASGDVYLRWITIGSPNTLLLGDLGSVSGSAIDAHYGLKLRFYGGTVNVITDGAASSVNIFSYAGVGRIALYRSFELGSSGTITSVACRLSDNVSVAARYTDYKIIIGHSNLESIAGSPAPATYNFVDQKIAVDGTVSVPTGLLKGDWIEIPLTTPFKYDGKSNLAIWMGTTVNSGAGVLHHVSLSTTDGVRYPDQTALGMPGGATVGSLQNSKVDMQFTIKK